MGNPRKDMDVSIRPSQVRGRVAAPASKSYTHRAILAAGLADVTRVTDVLDSADTQATMRAVEAFGGAVTRQEAALEIEGCRGKPSVPDDVIDCANSGTTMRLVLGTAGVVDGITVLTGDASLRSRPQGPLLTALSALGARAESTRGTGEAPVVVKGPISGDAVSIPGDVSSQYISSLLMAGGLTDDGIAIELETPLKSAPYVDITLEVLEAFGIDANETQNGFVVHGGQSYRRERPYAVPGDFSSISYLVAAGAVAGDDELVITGAHPSAQGDTAILDVVERMGADLSWDRSAGEIRVRPAEFTGVEVDVADTPDLLPTIATLGAIADGTTHIVNCAHVRLKETDRVAAMASELDAMGAVVEETEDTLTVIGSESNLRGAAVRGYHDHRIIMALAVAGLVATGETTITGAEHVAVSFPTFFETLETIGARVTRM